MSESGDNPDLDLLRSLAENLETEEREIEQPSWIIPAQTQPTLLTPPKQRHAFTVRVDLDSTKPPVWRRLRVASDLTLEEFHQVLQIAMGWEESHLHKFTMGPGALSYEVAPFITDFDELEGVDGIHEGDVTLGQVLGKPKDRLYYEYDFGDSWRHTIRLESVGAWQDDFEPARCLTGKRACPPENCGGIPGYQEILRLLDGQPVPEDIMTRVELQQWLPTDFDPTRFDLERINRMLTAPEIPQLIDGWNPHLSEMMETVISPAERFVRGFLATALEPSQLMIPEASQVTRRFRALLKVVGDGIKLTQTGRFPVAVLKQLAEEIGEFGTTKNIRSEDDVPAIGATRESALAMGLLRKANGQLNLTARGHRVQGDPEALLSHIASRVPLGRKRSQQDACITTLLAAASGLPWRRPARDAVVFFGALGWTGNAPLDELLYYEAQPTTSLLLALLGFDDDSPALPQRLARLLLTR